MAKHCILWALGWLCLALTWTAHASGAAPSTESDATAACTTENVLAKRAPISVVDVSGNGALTTDGAVPEAGSPWDTTAAVILESSGATITYDLGEARPIGALYVQADANDSYDVWGSTVSSAEGFQRLVSLPNVVDRGPGLRDRVAEFAPVRVRYIRLTVGAGDDAYSVSEIAAYCRAPSPFPPSLSLAAVATPTAAASTPPPLPAGGAVADDSLWLKLGVLCAILSALLHVSRRTAPGKGDKPSNAPSEATGRSWPHRALLGLFFVSGCAALIYEVIWMHLLRLVIGASALSVAIVLASFMGGMFLGSLLFARLVRPRYNPVVVYAVLELAIGIFGLAMPAMLPAVKYVYIGLFGYGPLGIALRAVIAAAMLLPPTALMGATLPAISRRYTADRRGMAALTSLYAANTLGAVAGCLLAAFYLLAFWDVWVATVVAAGLNFAIAAAVWRWKGSLFVGVPSRGVRIPDKTRLQPVANGWPIYWAAALSGLTALGAQVIWTRLLTLLFGASVYAFAIILAVFLAGLGIGSAWASSALRRGTDAVRGTYYSQLGLIPTMVAGGYLLAKALPYGSPPGWIPISALHALDIVRAVVVVLPATIFWGMSFPFVLAAASRHSDDTGHATGRVYASNTIGSIIGALATSFWLIPTYGTHRAGQVLVFVAAMSAAGLVGATVRGSGDSAVRLGSTAWFTRSLVPLAVGLLGVGLLPAFPREFLAHGRYLVWVDQRDQYPYVSEGAASTVAVHVAPDGYSNFHVSGRVEATNNPNDLRTERLIGHISGFVHPHPESALVVGLGAGVTAGALTLHPEIKRIVICEIEPRVVGATNLFAKENYAVLSNPRVQIVFDDARHYLATTREKFDIITSDPIHPWVRGNSILFSREYYAIVKEHLNPGGIASQWVPLYETSELAIQIQAKTFVNAFADATVWNTITNNRGYDVVFVGGNEPLRVDVNDVQARIGRNPAIEASLREVRLGSALSLLSTYGTNGQDMSAWLAQVPVNRDFSLKLEYISGLAMNEHHADEIYGRMIAGRKFPERLFVAAPETAGVLSRRILGEAGR